MDLGVIVAVVGATAILLSALITYLGVRYNARQLAAAAVRGAELEEDRIDLERIESLAGEVRDLRQQRTEDRAEHHAEVVQLRNDHAARIRGLTERINGLERLRAGDRTAIRTLTDYVRVLLQLLRDHEIEAPPPPGGLG